MTVFDVAAHLDQQGVTDADKVEVGRVEVGEHQPVGIGRRPVILDPEIAVMLLVDIDIAARPAELDVAAAPTDEDILAGAAADAFGAGSAEMRGAVDDVGGDVAQSGVTNRRKIRIQQTHVS